MFGWLVRNAAPIFVAAFVVFAFGVFSYVTLPRESAPDIKVPFVLVTTPYIGVSPKDIESLVSIPIENEVAGVKGLKEMRSTSSEGISSVFLEFEPDVVIEDALQKVRDRVNRAKTSLPDDVEEPIVREISFTDIPVMLVTVAGPQDETVLKALVEDLEDEVGRISGVLEADVAGGTEREFQVLVDPARLSHYEVTLNDVIGGIQGENVNIPGGTVKRGDGNVLLRVPAELKQADEIEGSPVKIQGGNAIKVRDVARVQDGLADRSTYARMNGQAAVSLRVKKRTGANIVSVADAVREIVERQSQDWPEGVEYRILADQSKAIRSMVTELQNNILTALLLVVGVILFFMGVRNSLFVALAIPLSMFGSMAVLQALGFTLNMVVLFSLILALGMLVDNAIVVVENIYRHRELGKDSRQAAVDGTKEVALAVAASTATTVAAFFPMIFWGGIMGQFMGYLPKTLIIVLVASLMVAVLILPVFMSRLMGNVRKSKDAPAVESDAEALARIEAADAAKYENPTGIMGMYKSVLELSIRFRYAALSLGFASLIVTGVIYGVFNHGVEFFPTTDPSRAIISVRGPDGTDLDTTDAIVRKIERTLAAEPDVDVFVSEVGVASGGGGALLGTTSSPQAARITVDFLPDAASATADETPRSEPSAQTVLRLRKAFGELAGAEITVEPESEGPPVGADIEVKVQGDDFDAVGQLAQLLRREIDKVDHIADLSDDYRVNRPELSLRIDRAAAKQAGVSTGLVGNTVRTAVAGATATTVRDGDDEYDVVVRMAPEFTDNVQAVLDLRLPGRQERDPAVYMVPLSSVAQYDLAGGSGAINRVDQSLTVTITGDVVEGQAVDVAQAAVKKILETYDMPAGMTAELGGSSSEQDAAGRFLLWAMIVALVLIFIVLVTQFNDLVQPFIILVTVLLSLIGVLWGLLITGTPFGIMMTGIGVISLAGVVVNNAIVLLDYVAQLRRDGHPSHEALVRAGMTRFRPVMLTAITTVLGLVPMALGIAMEVGIWWVGSVPIPTVGLVLGSQSSAFWGPMAVAVIFGLSFATVLTLVMVPTLYSIYTDIMSLLGGRNARAKKTVVAVAKIGLATLGFGVAGLALAPTADAATLEEAWAAAERDNVDAKLSREVTFQAKNQRIQAWALVQPRVSGALNYSYLSYGDVKLDFSDLLEDVPIPIEAPEPTVIQRGSNWDASLTVSQPLFNGSAFPLLVGAYEQVGAAELDETRSNQQIRAGVARAYYGLAASREAVKLSEKSVLTAKSQLDLAQRQLDAGLATRRAVLQGKLSVAQAERDLRRSTEQRINAEEAFSRLTGLPPEEPLEGEFSVEVPSSFEDAFSAAKSKRPDLEASEIRERVAGLQISAEKLAWLPSVDARWTGIYNQTPGFANQSTYWQAGLAANWTLWDGGARLAAIRQAASQKRQASLSVERTELDVREQVRTAWEAYDRARGTASAVEAEVMLAEDGLDLARKGFQAGTVTFLEVEQAELGLRGAELTRLNEQMSMRLAVVDLLLAMGEL
ncbi:MAG: efflux RND transporter permease subunit [Myxococcota bacterium]